MTYILLYKVDSDTDLTFKNIDMQKDNTKILVKYTMLKRTDLLIYFQLLGAIIFHNSINDCSLILI